MKLKYDTPDFICGGSSDIELEAFEASDENLDEAD